MWIHNIKIRDLKSIEEININFNKDNHISLIYGQNGMGKTTILEAISLLGHLHTMRQVTLLPVNIKIEDSMLYKVLKNTASSDLGFLSDLCTWLNPKEKNLDTCFQYQLTNDKATKINESVIQFTISLTKGADPFNILIFFRTDSDTSITKTLGRKAFNDLKMNDCYALIWEQNDTTKIEKLLTHLSKSTKYLIPETASSNLLELCKHDDHDSYIDSLKTNNIGFTFYLNTDLNDFGRGRDVRESVKDIFGDFTDEWIDRLGIKFIENDVKNEKIFGKKEELQVLLNKILTPTPFYEKCYTFLTRSQTTDDNFELVKCSVVKDDQYKWKPEIKIKRYRKDKTTQDAVTLDYLSAGENECFFIFMYLLGININNSICLLDEPDLHLSQFSKKPFYESLYKLLADSDNNCQVIISTHSGFAYTNPEITERFLIRKKKNDKKHSHKYPRWFSFTLAFEYLRTAFAILDWTFIPYVLLFAFLFSYGSDVITAFDPATSLTHIKILNFIVLISLYIIGLRLVWKCVLYVKRKLPFLK
jgi:predicted ATPase